MDNKIAYGGGVDKLQPLDLKHVENTHEKNGNNDSVKYKWLHMDKCIISIV